MTTKENLEATFQGETSEVGLYLAMARQAEQEGHAQAALYLRHVAWEEAGHAAAAAALLGKTADTKSNLNQLVNGESSANSMKTQAADQARKEGNEAAARFFESAAADEDRHRAGFTGLLAKL